MGVCKESIRTMRIKSFFSVGVYVVTFAFGVIKHFFLQPVLKHKSSFYLKSFRASHSLICVVHVVQYLLCNTRYRSCLHRLNGFQRLVKLLNLQPRPA